MNKFHRNLVFGLAMLCLHLSLSAQPGTWTWMKGVQAGNSLGYFGALGVPSPNNRPPGIYEAAHWTDLTGKFWIFGGSNFNGYPYSALWRFDPSTNMWTWIKGPQGTYYAGVYGTQGIGAPSNQPGSRLYAASSWVDNNGDLWMFGGFGLDGLGSNGTLSDLWKYNIASNQWTWMSGPNAVNDPGVYGTRGVPNAGNRPPGRCESNTVWVDANNNFWLFGGEGANGILFDHVWHYNTATHQWTWMAGSNTPGDFPVYGIQGVAAPGNTPGARRSYTSWKDCNGEFWFFGGFNRPSETSADMWKFDPVTAQWTWMDGYAAANTPSGFTTRCTPSNTTIPAARFENRASWTDSQGRFWNFGGFSRQSYDALDDLWCYDPNTRTFAWIAGSNLINQPSVYGQLGVGAPANTPGARGGAMSFQDLQGNFWLFGGYDILNSRLFSDLWKYTPDTLCLGAPTGLPSAAFTAQPMTGCAPLTTNFNNTSANATSFYWDFGDGSTASATNPMHTFANVGTYTVTLLASTVGCLPAHDTATATIIVTAGFPLDIGPDQALCQGDSLVLNSGITGANFLWSDNSTGATLTVHQGGLYWVQVTDVAGCIMRDSVMVTMSSAPFSLGPDRVICAGNTTVLDAGNPGSAYLWSNNATTQTIVVTTTGDYWAEVTLPSGCIRRDTVHISVASPPIVDLGQDRSICPGAAVVLDGGNQPNASFLWSTTAQSQSIAASAAGIYWVQVTDNFGCMGRDSISVSFAPVPLAVLGNDTSICQGDSLQLDAGNAGSTFQWSTGATAQMISVDQAGYYAVNVTSPFGCTGSGSISVVVLSDFAVELGKDTVFCSDESWTLRAASGNLNTVWSSGSAASTFTATESGLYWVEVWNACFAHRDSIRLTFLADSSGPFLPTAFTPNGDGLNDVFKVEGLHTDDAFALRVYDRWGKLIFETTNPLDGWDGDFQNVGAPEGVYPIWVQVVDCRGKLRPIRGAVTLIR
jgi:gliding motility-associated-like protein